MSEEKSKSILPDIFAYIMILLCVVGMLVSAYVLFERPRTTEVVVHVCQIDSLEHDYVLSAADAAALFQEIEKKELRLEERYNYVLEQSENEFRWQTYISLIISVIVAICGFFGYKSIKDLQDDVRKESKMIATDTAKDTAKETANAVADTTARDVAKNVADATARSVAKMIAEEAAKTVSEETTKTEVSRLMPGEVQKYLKDNLPTQVYNSVSTVFKEDIYNSLKQELLLQIDKKRIATSPKEREKKAKEETTVVLENIAKADKEGNNLFQNQ